VTSSSPTAAIEPRIVAEGPGGSLQDMSVLEETGIAFDPTATPLDLSKAEKRRTTALMLAITAYRDQIIKDADMFIAIARESRTEPETKIHPATIRGVVEAAIEFDLFISGAYEAPVARTPSAPASDSAEKSDEGA